MTKIVDGIKEGQYFSITRQFTEQDMLRFGEISKDYNPFHYDDIFAGSRGFNGRITHGMLVASMVSEIGGQLSMLVAELNFLFRRPVYFEMKLNAVTLS